MLKFELCRACGAGALFYEMLLPDGAAGGSGFGSGSRRSHGRSSGGGCGRTACGHADSQCQSSSNDSSILEFHVKYTPLKFLRIQINQQGVMDDEDDYTGISTKNQDAYVHFER